MENKSLSQQICEVCGIKPKYKYKRIPCEFFEGVVYVCKLKSSSDDEVICGDPSNCDDYTPSISHRYRHEEKPFYPDFENNNNNFVKLGELKIKTTKKSHTLFEILSLECNFTNKKDFLEFLVNHINDKKYYSGSYIFTFRDKIKQAIKNNQWEV